MSLSTCRRRRRRRRGRCRFEVCCFLTEGSRACHLKVGSGNIFELAIDGDVLQVVCTFVEGRSCTPVGERVLDQ